MCLLDLTDFPTADPGLIQLPAGHGFLVGDVVQFSIEGGATLVTGLTADTEYHIISIDSDQKRHCFGYGRWYWHCLYQLLSADTPGGHINMKLTEFTSVCNVSSFDFSLDREQIETTSLSCGCSTRWFRSGVI